MTDEQTLARSAKRILTPRFVAILLIAAAGAGLLATWDRSDHEPVSDEPPPEAAARNDRYSLSDCFSRRLQNEERLGEIAAAQAAGEWEPPSPDEVREIGYGVMIESVFCRAAVAEACTPYTEAAANGRTPSAAAYDACAGACLAWDAVVCCEAGPPHGWVPPTIVCAPVCDIDRDNKVTARDYAGECDEVAAWLDSDCDGITVGLSGAAKQLAELSARSAPICHDAELVNVATLPPTLWVDPEWNYWSGTVSAAGTGPPNTELLTRYRCGGNATWSCIDYSR
ncbi:MAG: hypothetical protein F4062_05815 [Acidimicrobiia bacterium]|nr:hypothetical protein [Acidimicrobiia bacterium]